jgi:surface carbohydrate biosynthesis protein
MKNKIVYIHIDTFRREYSSSYLLANIFRSKGYAVYMTSRLTTHILLKFFIPDILIITHTFTLNNDMKERVQSAGCKIFVNIVEEVINDVTYMSLMYRDNVNPHKLDGIFVWSNWAKNWIIEKTKIDTNKIHVIGSIRNSVLLRIAKLKKNNDSADNYISFITRFESLNVWNKRHPFVDLLTIDPEDTNDPDGRFYFEKKIIDAESFAIFSKLISLLLKKAKNIIKIRPHPNEFVDSYQILENHFGKNLVLDKTIDLCEFYYNSRVIVGPVSSAFVEAYLLKIPIISFHAIQKNQYSSFEVQESLDLLSEAAYNPKSVAEALELCIDPALSPKTSVQLDEFLEKQYSLLSNPDPAVKMVDIIHSECISNQPLHSHISRLSVWICLKLIECLRIFTQLLGLGLPYNISKKYNYNSLIHRPSSFLKNNLHG